MSAAGAETRAGLLEGETEGDTGPGVVQPPRDHVVARAAVSLRSGALSASSPMGRGRRSRALTGRRICGACGRVVPRLLQDRWRTAGSPGRPRRLPAV